MARKPQMAEITIGGNLPAALLEQFLGELNSTAARSANTMAKSSAPRPPSNSAKPSTKAGICSLWPTSSTSWSASAWRTASPLTYAALPGDVYFRPGMKRPEPSDKSSDALLDTGNIRPVAKELAGLVTVALTREKVLAAAVKVIRHLNALLPPELPPLEIEE